jgi:serine/threonine-protein kinase
LRTSLARGEPSEVLSHIDPDETHSSSLFGALATVPLDSASSRTLLQRRIAYFALVSAFIAAGFQLIGRLTNLGAANIIDRNMGARTLQIQLLTMGLYLAAWLRMRTGTRSSRELSVFDVLITVVPPLNSSRAIDGMLPLMRPELILMLIVAHELILRATLVPSSARRTFVIGCVLCLPVVARTYVYYAARASPLLPPPQLYTLGVCAWSTASIGVSTVISRTMFGLRQKVVQTAQLGQYTLERKIGQGGMGIVYRARHALLRRPTAIKLLSPDRTDRRDYARFEREVQLTAALTHPNTISIYDYGRTPEGVFYYAMEYLDGFDLQQLIELDGPQKPACVVRILEQVAGALAEAHARGLIHRDIKPANVILCERGGQPAVAKVVDFGLVKRIHAGAEASTSTATAGIIGTPLYLSPEAILKPESVDARSDLYGLGAVAYFLLTGAPPFSGSTVVEICGHHMHTPPPPLAGRASQEIPGALDALVMRLLAKAPSDRPASASELSDELATLRASMPWPREAIARWWAAVLERRAEPDQPRPSGTPVGSSQTLAVDLGRR